MAIGNDQNERIVCDDLPFDVADIGFECDHRGVDDALIQIPDKYMVFFFDPLESQLGIILAQRRRQMRREIRRDRRDDSNPQSACERITTAPSGLEENLDLSQNGARAFNEFQSGGGD